MARVPLGDHDTFLREFDESEASAHIPYRLEHAVIMPEECYVAVEVMSPPDEKGYLNMHFQETPSRLVIAKQLGVEARKSLFLCLNPVMDDMDIVHIVPKEVPAILGPMGPDGRRKVAFPLHACFT
jgi:hypothetical protein